MPFAMRKILPLLILLLLASRAACADQSCVWIEAETPQNTNFPPAERNPFAPANPAEAALLSGGKWLGISDERKLPLFAEYAVTVPGGSAWHFYTRKFWQHGPFRWRFDEGAWHEVKSAGLMDEVSMRQFVSVNWISLGPVELMAGTHTLRIELLEEKGAAAFDCFALTRQPFFPRGALKPDENYGRAPEGWLPFEPAVDDFHASAIDLRFLNEKFAGEHGPIQVKDGQFVHATTGEPVRFWAVNAGHGIAALDHASLDYYARQLAKNGVNMVRLHGGVFIGGDGPDKLKADPAKIERLQYLVAALKREGIYVCLSTYFPLWLQLQAKDGLAGYHGENPFALLFFQPEFQEIYRGWWKALLLASNPHGPKLTDDPAVAQLELVNEDSVFFWTFLPGERVPWAQMEILEKQFGDWLIKKYGSLAAATAAWKAKPNPRDDLATGRIGLLAAGQIVPQRGELRTQDTARFLTERQTEFFTEHRRFLRETLGYKGLVYGSNWQTADARVLGPLDKFSNTAGDFLDAHGYFGGPHKGPRAGYSLSAGDTFRERTALRFENEKGEPAASFDLPLANIRYDDLPSTITELNWTPPGRFRAEFVPLAASLGALQGLNGLHFFATGGPTWQSTLTKFPVQTPTVMGQFPAAALIYRRGLLREGDTVADIRLRLDDLFALKGAPVTAPQNLDELRAQDVPKDGRAASVATVQTLDPLAHYAGKVIVRFEKAAGSSRVADLSPFIDRAAKTIRSTTGELLWDYGAGRLTINAPQAAGVVGFFEPGKAETAGIMKLDLRNDYASVLLVALDDRPLAESKRLLLQVMTEDSNYGWKESGDARGEKKIESVGQPPLVVRSPHGRVTLNRADAATLLVTPLDLNGYPASAPAAAGAAIELRSATLSYLIENPAGR